MGSDTVLIDGKTCELYSCFHSAFHIEVISHYWLNYVEMIFFCLENYKAYWIYFVSSPSVPLISHPKKNGVYL